jgi:hypothetical protein
MSARRDLAPRECTVPGCDCRQHEWDGRSCVLNTDPPSGCRCGHFTSQHRFRWSDDNA